MSTPIMTIGKNLSGVDVKYDYSSLVTKLYPRGTGSAPSELTLNTPNWYPSGDLSQLVYDHSDGNYAHFRLPGQYSAYAGSPNYHDGWPIPAGDYVGHALAMAYNQAVWANQPGASIGSPSDAIAISFYVGYNFRIYDVALNLQRIIKPPGTDWATQPRFVVGLYSTTASTAIPGVQQAGYRVPNQGPLTWCYGDLLSISSASPQWYSFPLQSNAYLAGGYAIVIAPYPTSNTQWSVNDYLWVQGSPSHSSSVPCYAEQCRSGITPKNWILPIGTSSGIGATPYTGQLAFKLRMVSHDVTSQFSMSGTDPGRMIKTPIADYVPTDPYIFHYQHAPYLVNWSAYDQYGKFEGTYKDDSVTTQNALYLAGTQYIQSASQPAVTISLSAADLYDLDPEKNWAEELMVGGLVRVIDDVLGIDEECLITKIEKQDLTQPHVLDTLTLNNVHLSAQKLMAQLSKSSQRSPKYLQGQTVETPYTTAGSVSSGSPAEMSFYIRNATTLTHSVKLTVDTPGSFKMYVDGTPVGGGAVFQGMNEIDVLDQLTKAHNGQPTPGVHTVEVHSA